MQASGNPLMHRSMEWSRTEDSRKRLLCGRVPSPPERRIGPTILACVACVAHARVGAPGRVDECLVLLERRLAGSQAGGKGGEQAVRGDRIERHGRVADRQPTVAAGAVEARTAGVDTPR